MLGLGDEVICIDDRRTDGWTAKEFPEWVVQKEKYIIREFLENDEIVAGVLVVELRNPEIYIKLIDRVQEPAFATWRFEKMRTAYEIAEERKEVEEFVNKLYD